MSKRSKPPRASRARTATRKEPTSSGRGKAKPPTRSRAAGSAKTPEPRAATALQKRAIDVGLRQIARVLSKVSGQKWEVEISTPERIWARRAVIKVSGRSKVGYGAIDAALDVMADDPKIRGALDKYAAAIRIASVDANERKPRHYSASYSASFDQAIGNTMEQVQRWAASYGEGVEADPDDGDSRVREFVVMVGKPFARTTRSKRFTKGGKRKDTRDRSDRKRKR